MRHSLAKAVALAFAFACAAGTFVYLERTMLALAHGGT